MELFFQAAAGVLLAVILSFALRSQDKDLGLVLTLAVCVMVITLAASYLRPVLDFLGKLETLGNLNGELTQILFKVTGIGIISEIVALVCADSGNASLGKALQTMGTAVILWLSIPIFDALLNLIQNILGEL